MGDSPAKTTIGRRARTAAGSAVINWVTPGPQVTEATASVLVPDVDGMHARQFGKGGGPMHVAVAHHDELRVDSLRKERFCEGFIEFWHGRGTLRWTPADGAPAAVAIIGIRHLPLAAPRKRYIRLARRRKRASSLFLAAQESASGTKRTCQPWRSMSASLIGHSGSSTFRLSTSAVSMSLAGSRFSSESAPRPFHHGIRERGGTTWLAALPSDRRQVQADMRTHLIHRPVRDIIPPSVKLEFPPIGFDPVRLRCCCGWLLGPPRLGA